MSTLTLVHVGLSLIGIAAGLVVIYGFLTGLRLKGWNWLFLVTTILTSVTGYFYPIHGVTPGIVVGAISLVVLALALVALKKSWTKTYIITCTIAEFFNVLVLIVQSFMKIPALHALAPTGTEPITTVCKVLALVLFVVLAWLAIRKKAFVLV
jgi:hypothetical protein